MEATTRRAPFRDRREAGQLLAKDPRLKRFRGTENAIVLGLPRGGVPVAHEIAAALDLPLDVFVVRKLGVPGHEELAMGAIAAGGTRVIETDVVGRLGLDEGTIDAATARELRELEERERRYREGLPTLDLRDRLAIVVDDGLATGSTMRAAINALKAQEPKAVVVAVPVAPPQTCAALEREADEVICVLTPEFLGAVGLAYERFGQTTDDEVIELLGRSQETRPTPPEAPGSAPRASH